MFTRWPVTPTLDTDEVVDLLLDCTMHLVKLAERVGRRPAAASVVLAEEGDEATGFASIVGERHWRGVPVRTWLEEDLELPVTVGHEVRAGALAEALLGAGRGSRALLYVPVGDRLPAAIILDGQAGDGHRSVVGDLGRLPTWTTCDAGTRGAERVEDIASASAVTRRYESAGGEAGLSALAVHQRAKAGDADAARVWGDAIEAFADALASAATMLSPDRVVVGGEFAEAGKAYFRQLRRAVAARVQSPLVIVPAQLGFQGSLLGAALLTREARATVQPR
ncbi:ROK family protein [Streptomyces sp. NPDC096324]|uniref:ROK family protein n=1 Tax=Streptomyces sp. NPDC096324 TaxID=3366085 RepID=UPI003809F734